MPHDIQSPTGSSTIRRIWRWIAGLGAAVLLICIVVTIAISRAEPILRARVVETLSTRFKGPVELEQFHVLLSHGIQVRGEGLRIYGEDDPNPHQAGVQPLISVSEFRFQAGILELLLSPMHVDTVYLKGLRLNVPPRQRQQKGMHSWGDKIKMYVHHFVCEDAQLVINTAKPDKLPLEFDINHLNMKGIGPGQPLQFEATLINPKPLGNIATRGSFGPWQADSPRDTQVRGSYAFDNVDLGTIKGISGILSSHGDYAGSLDRIVVDGTTNAPDFRVATSGHPVPLRTEFHAIVDGTSGDTYLQPVNAELLGSSIMAQGSVLQVKNGEGHHILLDVTIEKGRMQDLLQVGVRTETKRSRGV